MPPWEMISWVTVWMVLEGELGLGLGLGSGVGDEVVLAATMTGVGLVVSIPVGIWVR